MWCWFNWLIVLIFCVFFYFKVMIMSSDSLRHQKAANEYNVMDTFRCARFAKWTVTIRTWLGMEWNGITNGTSALYRPFCAIKIYIVFETINSNKTFKWYIKHLYGWLECINGVVYIKTTMMSKHKNVNTMNEWKTTRILLMVDISEHD